MRVRLGLIVVPAHKQRTPARGPGPLPSLSRRRRGRSGPGERCPCITFIAKVDVAAPIARCGQLIRPAIGRRRACWIGGTDEDGWVRHVGQQDPLPCHALRWPARPAGGLIGAGRVATTVIPVHREGSRELAKMVRAGDPLGRAASSPNGHQEQRREQEDKEDRQQRCDELRPPLRSPVSFGRASTCAEQCHRCVRVRRDPEASCTDRPTSAPVGPGPVGRPSPYAIRRARRSRSSPVPLRPGSP